MTISSTSSRMQYTGNGSVSTYSYTFRIIAASDLVVTRTDLSGNQTPLALTTDYTVAGAGISSGGSITLVAGNLAAGFGLTILRVRPLTQTADIRNQGAFYPETYEDALDDLVMKDQQQQEQIGRSLKMASSVDPSVFDPTLPAALVGAGGTIPVVNPAGTGFAVGPPLANIAAAAAEGAAAAASAAAALLSANAAAASAAAAAASATTTSVGAPPQIVSVNPSSGNISSLSQAIVVTFSEGMNVSTSGPSFAGSIANPANWVLASSSGTVSISSITTTSTSATINTTGSGVSSGSTLTLTATTGLQSSGGSALTGAIVNTYAYIFVSAGSNPTILTWSPASSTVGSIPGTIAVTFSKTMNAGGTGGANSPTNPANWAISATSGSISISSITMSGNVATLVLSSSGILNGSGIALAALVTIQDSSGNALTGGLTVGYAYSTSGGTTSANFQASQEGGRKPGMPGTYSLNMGTTLATGSCKNETFGVVLQLTASANTALGATGLPAGFSLAWFKAQPQTSTTPSIAHGPVGAYYDPLIPVGNQLTVATPGTAETDWLWCDITVAGSVAAGTYNFTLTAGANSIAVTHTVWNITLPTTPTVPLYVYSPQMGYFAGKQTNGSQVANEGVLGQQYSAMFNAHRMVPFAQEENWIPLLTAGTPSAGLNLALNGTGFSFNSNVLPYNLGAAEYLPLHSTYAGQFNGTPSNAYLEQVTVGTQYASAQNYSLLQVGNASFKTNNFSYFIDEPNWTSNSGSMLTAVVAELTAIKAMANPFWSKIMITTEIQSAFQGVTPSGYSSPINLVDIYTAIQSNLNQSGHSTSSQYTTQARSVWGGGTPGTPALWTYGACQSHGCSGGSGGDGSPDLMVDQESYHGIAYSVVAYLLGSLGTLYYRDMIQLSWDGVLGSSTDMWAPGGVYSSGGNGDGTLIWCGRAGSYGMTANQPVASIRMKNLREGLNLVDMMDAAIVAGKVSIATLVADMEGTGVTTPLGTKWRQKYADYVSYRAMLGAALTGGTYVAPAAASPGEFYTASIQAAAGSTSVTFLPPVNQIAPATSYQLWSSTVPGGPYLTLCGTHSGGGTVGTSISISDTSGTPAIKYYYRVKALNASAYTWSKAELSATFAAANTTGPGAVSGLALWYAADLGVTADGSGNVTALADQSPTGYNLTSASGHRPTLVANAYRSNPTLRFAGTGVAGTSVSTYQCLDSSQTQLSPTIQAVTVFAVFNPADATTIMSFMNDQDGTNFFLSTNHGGKLFSTGALSGPIDSAAAASATLNLVAYTSTAAAGNGQGKIYVNGTLDTTGSVSADFPNLHWVRLGAGNHSGGSPGAPSLYWYTGDLCEFIVYNTVLGSTDMGSVTAYLKTKWGIT